MTLLNLEHIPVQGQCPRCDQDNQRLPPPVAQGLREVLGQSYHYQYGGRRFRLHNQDGIRHLRAVRNLEGSGQHGGCEVYGEIQGRKPIVLIAFSRTGRYRQ